MLNLTVTESGIRVDAYVTKTVSELSRTRAASLIAEQRILLDGKPVKSSRKVEVGQKLSIDIPAPEPTTALAEDIPLDIVYEDDDVIVINKAQGMVVHPAPGHRTGTLVHALLHHCAGSLSDINGVIRPGIVHRIDKDTSGLMLAVKNNAAHVKMAEMIAKHEVVREYRCVVHGTVETESGMVDAPIGRGNGDRRRMVVCEDGKPSVTTFRVVERFRKATDLQLRLETGRTHQIRAHMTFIGHPPLGDPLYAPKRKNYGLKGQALHSTFVEFSHPISGETLSFTAPVPAYYETLLAQLRDE